MQFGLVGYPVGHSLSPWIHQQFLESTGTSGEYRLYETEPEQFGERMKQFRESEIDGFNVTVPFKQKIIRYLDEIDADARKTGAVNTVVCRNGTWIGYNTDGTGYLRSLRDAYPSLFQPAINILIIGAGGAARAIYRALASAGFLHIDLANRTKAKAEGLLSLKEEKMETTTLSVTEAENQLEKYDLIIQTTSVGMKPDSERQILSLERLKESAVVSDIVYQPIQTQLLRQAEQKGGQIHYGHAMLLYQAQYAFEIWTGKTVPLNDSLIKLEERLRGK